ALVLAPNQRPAFVSVDQIASVVADNAGRACVHQRPDARLLACLDDGGGPVDIDLLEQGVRDLVVGLGGGRGGVDDDVGLGLVEDGLEFVGIGDVGVEVGHA